MDELCVDASGFEFGDQSRPDRVGADLPKKPHRLTKYAGSGRDVGRTATAATQDDGRRISRNVDGSCELHDDVIDQVAESCEHVATVDTQTSTYPVLSPR